MAQPGFESVDASVRVARESVAAVWCVSRFHSRCCKCRLLHCAHSTTQYRKLSVYTVVIAFSMSPVCAFVIPCTCFFLIRKDVTDFD
jgi:hypothetical protein